MKSARVRRLLRHGSERHTVFHDRTLPKLMPGSRGTALFSRFNRESIGEELAETPGKRLGNAVSRPIKLRSTASLLLSPFFIDSIFESGPISAQGHVSGASSGAAKARGAGPLSLEPRNGQPGRRVINFVK